MHKKADGHSHGDITQNVLIIALILAAVFAGVESVAGWWSGSLALLSDAGHMISDALALGLAAFANWVAKKPPSVQHSYGLGRAEILGAWISSLFVLLVAIFVVVEAIRRLHEPQAVSGGFVMIVAFLGLVVNLVIAWVLTHGEQSLNVRAAVLHVMGDLLGSVAALISGAVIYYTGWAPIDPILSIFISILIVVSSFRLLRESLLVLMEGVPQHIDINVVGKEMAQIDKVKSVHDLHIWTLSSGVIVLTAHVEIDEFHNWTKILEKLRNMLSDKYDIDHVTLQPETHTHTLYHMPNAK